MNPISKTLIIVGIFFIITGVGYHFFGSSIPLGKLPGDIKIQKENSTFYFPIVSCLVVSAILSLISYLLKK